MIKLSYLIFRTILHIRYSFYPSCAYKLQEGLVASEKVKLRFRQSGGLQALGLRSCALLGVSDLEGTLYKFFSRQMGGPRHTVS